MDQTTATRIDRTGALERATNVDHANLERRGTEAYGLGSFKAWVHTMTPSIPVQLFLVYLAALSVHALLAGKISELVVIQYAVVLTLIPRWGLRALGVNVPALLECGVALIVMGTLVLGELSHFYDLLWWWDLPLHALTGSVLAYVAYLLFQKFFSERHIILSPVFMMLFSILISFGVSGGWEIYEFGVDQVFATHMQPSGADTMHDLVAGLIGAIIGTSLINKRSNFI